MLENLGTRRSALAVVSYLKARFFFRKKPQNLEEWVTRNFGNQLYQSFFKTYTEKVWGMPCTEISADWAAQRIKGLSLARAIKAALSPSPAEVPVAERSSVVKTLITSFRYPRLGPGMLWEAAAQRIQDMGGQLRMGCRVTG